MRQQRVRIQIGGEIEMLLTLEHWRRQMIMDIREGGNMYDNKDPWIF